MIEFLNNCSSFFPGFNRPAFLSLVGSVYISPYTDSSGNDPRPLTISNSYSEGDSLVIGGVSGDNNVYVGGLIGAKFGKKKGSFSFSSNQKNQVAFFAALFACLAKLAKSDGRAVGFLHRSMTFDQTRGDCVEIEWCPSSGYEGKRSSASPYTR